MKRKIGLDVGDVRIGVAVSDLLGICANPRETYVRSGDPVKDADYFSEYAKREEADAFVMGLPKNMDGSEGFRAQRCGEFAARLEELLPGVPVVMMDERLTTVGASRYLNETNTRGARRKGVLDTLSAQIILQNMLDRLRGTGGTI